MKAPQVVKITDPRHFAEETVFEMELRVERDLRKSVSEQGTGF